MIKKTQKGYMVLCTLLLFCKFKMYYNSQVQIVFV